MGEVTLQSVGVTAAKAPDAARDEVGLSWTALDTPALLVDLDRLEANVATMADHARRGGVSLRPHFKTHQSVAIADRQLSAGAVGVTVAKLDEAETLIAAGVDASILIANELVSVAKLERALSLATRCRLILAVDSAEGATRLAHAASAAGLVVDVSIEIDSGLARCGVAPSDAPELARAISSHRSLRLTGMFTHAGQSYAARSVAEVAAIAELEARSVVEAARATRAIGIPVETISAGSTPTARFLDGDSGLTEIRPGTYVFFDSLQVALGSARLDDCALSVATTVVSRPVPDRAVVDAGSKTLGLDRGAHSSSLLDDYGTVIDGEGALVRLSEEHGVMRITPGSPLAIGDRLRIVPNHACTVSNLGRRFYGLRDGVVSEVISIDAAGGVH